MWVLTRQIFQLVASDARRENSARPRVVLVIGGLQGGGAERVISDIANYWAGKDWDITMATWTGAQSADFYTLSSAVSRVCLDDCGQTDSVFATLRSVISRILSFRRLLKEGKPDAVLSFIDISNVLTILATRGLKTRVVISERTNPARYLS